MPYLAIVDFRLRVVGYVGKKPIHILIDSGSTYNLIDESVANKLHLHKEPIAPQLMTITNGNHLRCQFICKGLEWRLQDAMFKSNVWILTLGGCDMVLRVQWLKGLGILKWDFAKLIMEFNLNSKHYVLTALRNQDIKTFTEPINRRLLAFSSQLYMLQLIHLRDSTTNSLGEFIKMDSTPEPIPECITVLINQFASMFEEPKSLPSSRGHLDQKIPLQFGTNSISVRTYRYPIKQRDIIEKIIVEMVDHRVIQESSSPFASPVVLVGKRDGSWRLCVD